MRVVGGETFFFFFCGEVSAKYFLTLQSSTQLSSAVEITENIYEYFYPLIPLSGLAGGELYLCVCVCVCVCAREVRE